VQQAILLLLRNIWKFDKTQRQYIYSAAQEFGFQTPSFQEFAHRLADFLLAATETLKTQIRHDPATVKLGARD
jgi:hypothetical protein